MITPARYPYAPKQGWTSVGVIPHNRRTMNPTAEIARKTARRKNARRTTLALFGGLALGITLGVLYADKRGLRLPERYQPVHATTISGRPVTCYVDETGKFRSVETGEPVQIRKWTTP